MNAYVNPANAVTASRFLTLPPFLYCIHHGLYQWATVTLMVCGVFDLLDGAVARLFHCQSGFGELFDAIADAVCYGFFFLVLAYYRWIPLPAVVAIVVLGAVNSAMRGLYARRAGRATNYQSFAMERLVGFSAYVIGVGIARFAVDFYFYTLAGLMLIVVIHDAKRMLIDPMPS